jgi:hypothetical protein
LIFDPVVARSNGLNNDMLSFLLNTQYDSKRPMGNVAKGHISTIIKAWLVGLYKEVAPVLPRAIGWLDRPIVDDEDFGADRNFHRAMLHWAKALGEWMEGDRQATSLSSCAVLQVML